MTLYLYNIDRLLDTFDIIVKHDGKNLSGIVKEENWPPIRERINEFINHGLAKTYKFGYREVHITRKGYEVMELLKQVKARLDDNDGAEEYYVVNSNKGYMKNGKGME